MRMLITTLIILTLLVSGASAIQRVADNWDYGARVGVSFADYYNCDDCVKDSKAGFTAGVFGEYKASPNFSIQPEFLYVMKGWENVGADVDLGYLELPILFKLRVPTSGAITPNVYVGPSVAILVSAETLGIDIGDQFKSLDFGIAFGGGADFVVGTGKIVFDVRYTLGLVATPDNEILWNMPEGVPDIKNKAISFSIGFGW